jgi:hypothetical protein
MGCLILSDLHITYKRKRMRKKTEWKIKRKEERR